MKDLLRQFANNWCEENYPDKRGIKKAVTQFADLIALMLDEKYEGKIKKEN